NFQEVNQVLQQFRQQFTQQTNHLQLPKHQSLRVEEAFQPLTNIDFAADFKQMAEHLAEPTTFEADLPTGVQATLRNYQQTGFKWLKMLRNYHFSGILADDMGLGKTLQTLAFLLSEKEQGNAQGVSLIVAPA